MTTQSASVLAALLSCIACTPSMPRWHGSYELEYDSELELSGVRGGFHIRGTLDADNRGFALRDLSCRRLGEERSPALDPFCADLGDTYGFEKDESGVHRLHVAEGKQLEAEAAAKYLASVLQVSKPPGQDVASWGVTEIDTVGAYAAVYSHGNGVILRSKNRYLPGDGEVPDVDGAAEIRLQPSGVVASLQATETLKRSAGATGLPASTAFVRVRLRLRGGAPALAYDDEREKRWVGLDEPASATGLERAVDRRRARGVNTEQLLEVLAERPPREDEERRRIYDDASLALIAKIRLEPTTGGRIVGLCRELHPTCRVALGAMGAAGTPAAQVALMESYAALRRTPDSKEQASLRRQAIRALGTRLAGEPTPNTLRFLRGVLDDGTVGTQSAYGLGALAQRAHRAGRHELARRCLAPLVEGVNQGDAEKRVTFLRALSNAGTPEVVPAATPWLAAEDTRVAAAAMTSVHAVDLEHSSGLLQRGLADPRDAVRHSAVKVLAAHPGDWSPELSRALSRVAEDGSGGLAPRLAARVMRDRATR